MIHIHRNFDEFGFDGIFGRSAVMEEITRKSVCMNEDIGEILKEL